MELAIEIGISFQSRKREVGRGKREEKNGRGRGLGNVHFAADGNERDALVCLLCK